MMRSNKCGQGSADCEGTLWQENWFLLRDRSNPKLRFFVRWYSTLVSQDNKFSLLHDITVGEFNPCHQHIARSQIPQVTKASVMHPELGKRVIEVLAEIQPLAGITTNEDVAWEAQRSNAIRFPSWLKPISTYSPYIMPKATQLWKALWGFHFYFCWNLWSANDPSTHLPRHWFSAAICEPKQTWAVWSSRPLV